MENQKATELEVRYFNNLQELSDYLESTVEPLMIHLFPMIHSNLRLDQIGKADSRLKHILNHLSNKDINYWMIRNRANILHEIHLFNKAINHRWSNLDFDKYILRLNSDGVIVSIIRGNDFKN